MCSSDLAGPVRCDTDGRLVVPRGPGIGVAVDPDELEARTRHRAVLGPSGPTG